MSELFLYEKIDSSKELMGITKDVPEFIADNLSSNIVLRPYQKSAFENTLLYLEGSLSKNSSILTFFENSLIISSMSS